MWSQAKLLLILACFCVITPVAAEPRPYVIDIPRIAPPADDFIVDLLRMSLDASKQADEVIELRFAKYELSQERMIAEVRRGDTNSMMWTVTNKDREEKLRAIRIPLFKGLLGYRSLVIRKQDRANFAAVESLADLAQFTAGQGADWPDTPILRGNQLATVEGTTHINLYKMLAAHRFDYFPRGITETHEEKTLIQRHHAMVEPHLILYYPTALYFFVNHANDDLAMRLERGLQTLIKRGDYDRLFYALPQVQAALAELNDRDHTIISLANPDLAADTTTYPPIYWKHEAQHHLTPLSHRKKSGRTASSKSKPRH